MSVDLERVSGVLELLMRQSGRPVVARDYEKGGFREVPPDIAAAPDGLLPVFLVAGEAVWIEATRGGFSVSVEPDDRALIGYRVTAIGADGFTSVMLSMMEALAQAERPEGIVVEELETVWESAIERVKASSQDEGGF